jgi:hypothetical protein
LASRLPHNLYWLLPRVRAKYSGIQHETHFASSMKSDLYLENYCAPSQLPSMEILASQGDNYQNRQVLQILASPGCSGFAPGADLEMLAALAATRRDHPDLAGGGQSRSVKDRSHRPTRIYLQHRANIVRVRTGVVANCRRKGAANAGIGIFAQLLTQL